eukprot:268741_1
MSYKGDIFNLGPFQFIMEFYPNGEELDNKASAHWCLSLVSKPPSINVVFIQYKMSLIETNTFNSATVAFRNKRASVKWEDYVLKSDDIKTLNSLSFSLDLNVIDIYNKYGHTLNINDYDHIECKEFNVVKQNFKWNINDNVKLNEIKHAQNGISFKSKLFNIYKHQWYLILYPNGINSEDEGEIQIKLNMNELLNGIGGICVRFYIKCEKLNVYYSDYAHLTADCLCISVWETSFWKTAMIEYVSEININVEMELINVYDEMDNIITHNFLKLIEK